MRHQEVTTFASSRCFCSNRLYLLPSSVILLLLINTNYLVSGWAEIGTKSSVYCELCDQHTGCVFPYDDPGPNCIAIENSDVNYDEIRAIVHQHNVFRNNVARGHEARGNLGPQPPARNMMELTWDYELALLARRWAIQCNPVEKDSCRDVERFAVWQNMNVINLDTTSDSIDENSADNRNASSLRLISRHVQSWLDEVEHFDNARVGLVNFALENDTSYLGIAGAMINRVGCGRATYRGNLEDDEDSMVEPEVMYHDHNVATRNRLDALICNYGPIDRSTSQILYENYVADSEEPCSNEEIAPSREYDHLCVRRQKIRELSPRRDMENPTDEEADAPLDSDYHSAFHSNNGEEKRSRRISSSAVSFALRKGAGATIKFQALTEFLSLVLLHIITKTVHCC